MALDPNILKKINEDIAAAQGDAVALQAALARRAAYLAAEQNSGVTSTVKSKDDDFNRNEEENLETLSANPEAQAQDKKVDNDNAGDLANALKQIFAEYDKAMDAIMEEYGVYSEDEYTHEQQRLALENDNYAFVPTKEQAEAQDKMRNAVEKNVVQTSDKPTTPAETFANKVVIDKSQRNITAIVLNPNMVKNLDLLINVLTPELNVFKTRLKDTCEKGALLTPDQEMALRDNPDMKAKANSTGKPLTPGYEERINQENKGARPEERPSLNQTFRSKPEEEGPGYSVPPQNPTNHFKP